MILRLEMPSVDRTVRAGRLVRWRKAPGERVDYGDVLCEVAVEEVATLERAITARRLASLTGRKRARPAGAASTRNRRLLFHAEVVASDRGFLRSASAREGDRLVVGDLLALLSTGEDEPVDSAGGALPAGSAFRVVTNILDTVGE